MPPLHPNQRSISTDDIDLTPFKPSRYSSLFEDTPPSSTETSPKECFSATLPKATSPQIPINDYSSTPPARLETSNMRSIFTDTTNDDEEEDVFEMDMGDEMMFETESNEEEEEEEEGFKFHFNRLQYHPQGLKPNFIYVCVMSF